MILLLAVFISSVMTFGLVVGDLGWQNMLVGSVLVLALMYIFRKQISPDPLPNTGQAMHILVYVPVILYYLIIDILKGTWQVVCITLGLQPLRRPGFVKISFENYSHYAIGPVGFIITLSPGSFMVDVDWEEQVMLIHVLDASDPEAVRRDAEKYLQLWDYHPSVKSHTTPPEADDE